MNTGQQSSANRKITLVVADDHTIVRRGLITLLSLNERMQVVGEAEDGRVAMEYGGHTETRSCADGYQHAGTERPGGHAADQEADCPTSRSSS